MMSFFKDQCREFGWTSNIFFHKAIKGSSHSKSEEITSWSMELSSLLICLPIVCVGFFPLYLFQRFDVGLKCVIIVYTKVRRNTTLLAWDLVLTIKIDLEQVIKKNYFQFPDREKYRSNIGDLEVLLYLVYFCILDTNEILWIKQPALFL